MHSSNKLFSILIIVFSISSIKICKFCLICVIQLCFIKICIISLLFNFSPIYIVPVNNIFLILILIIICLRILSLSIRINWLIVKPIFWMISISNIGLRKKFFYLFIVPLSLLFKLVVFFPWMVFTIIIIINKLLFLLLQFFDLFSNTSMINIRFITYIKSSISINLIHFLLLKILFLFHFLF